MALIHKKTWPEYFQAILDGKKSFELRLADFDIKEGDVLVLEEYNPETKQYTGRKIEKQVKFLAKTKSQKFYTKEQVDEFGFIVIGF